MGGALAALPPGLTPPADALPPPSQIEERLRFIGDFELLEQVGEGGMGVVFKARQISLNRLVAIKMLLGGAFSSEEARKRFRVEAEMAAQLRHSNIVAIHAIGEHEGQPFFSMDYVEGQNLYELVEEQPLDPQRAARYLKTIAEAVHYAHECDVLHRDIKPSNILLDGQDRPWVTDFGLAKLMKPGSDLTQTGQVLGTPSYMSPEQADARQGEIGPHTDVYGLGALLYYLITGRPPFQAASPMENLEQVLTVEPAAPRVLNPAIPLDLETICLKCLAKAPRARYATAKELAEDLDCFRNNLPIKARRVTNTERLRRWCNRNRPLVASVAAAFVLLLGGLVGVFWQWRRAENNAANERTAAKLAMTERDRASKARRESDSLLQTMGIERAETLFTRNEGSAAIAQLTAILRSNPTNSTAAERLVHALLQRNYCIPALPALRPGSRFLSFSLSPSGCYFSTIHPGSNTLVWNTKTFTVGARIVHPGKSARGAWFGAEQDRLTVVLDDGSLLTWDSGALSKTALVPRIKGITSVLPLPHGNSVLVAGKDGTLGLYDSPSGELKTQFQSEKRMSDLRLLRCSADGRRIAAAYANQDIAVWDADSGQEVSHFKHLHWVGALDLSQNGTRLVAGSWDKATVWDLEKTPPLSRQFKHRGWFQAAEFSPDGCRILTIGQDSTVRLWNAATTELIAMLKHSGAINGCHFSPDGFRIATISDDHSARLWDAHNGEPLTDPVMHPAPVLEGGLTPDGQYLITCAADDRIRLWDCRLSRAMPAVLFTSGKGNGYRCTFSPSSAALLTWAAEQNSERFARLWQVDLPNDIEHLDGHDSPVTSTAFGPAEAGGAVVATGDSAGRVVIHHHGNQDVSVAIDALSQPVRYLRFNPRGQTLLAFPRNGNGAILDYSTGTVVALPREPSECAQVDYSRDGSRYFAVANGKVALCDAKTGDIEHWLQENEGTILGASFHPNGKAIATGSSQGAIRFWQVETALSSGTSLRQDQAVQSLEFSPDGNRLLTTSLDHRARLWDVNRRMLISDAMSHSDNVQNAVFSHSGRQVLTEGRDYSCRIWDGTSGLPLSEPFRQNPTFSGCFSADDTWVAVPNWRNTVTLRELYSLPQPIPSWFLSFAETLAGGRSAQQDDPVAMLSFDRLQAWQTNRSDSGSDGFYSKMVRWILSDRWTRPVSLSSPERLPSYVARLVRSRAYIQETDSLEELREQILLVPTNRVMLAEYLAHLERATAGNASESQREAEFYRQWMDRLRRYELLLARAVARRAEGHAEQAARVNLKALGIPARNPGTSNQMMDLSVYYLAAFTNSWHNPQDSGNDLASLSTGVQSHGGTEFDVRGLVQLASTETGKTCPGYPQQIEDILVEQRVRHLHFLLGTTWPESDGTEIAHFVVHYADGQTNNLPVVYGRNVRNWQSSDDN